MELVLLTGVSGFIAKHVALKLLNAGYSVRGTVRRLDRADEVRAALAPYLTEHAGALTFVQADLESEAGWADAFQGVTFAGSHTTYFRRFWRGCGTRTCRSRELALAWAVHMV